MRHSWLANDFGWCIRSYTVDCDGSTPQEIQATADIIDATEDTWNMMSRFFWEKDGTKKVNQINGVGVIELFVQAEYMKELNENHLPTTLKKLEARAVQNGAEKGWLVGQNVKTLAIGGHQVTMIAYYILGDLCRSCSHRSPGCLGCLQTRAPRSLQGSSQAEGKCGSIA